jgi:hypothetical protein
VLARGRAGEVKLLGQSYEVAELSQFHNASLYVAARTGL